MDLATNSVIQTVNLGLNFGPWSAALSPSGNELFICGAYGSQIAKMNTGTMSLVTWATSSAPSSCKVSADGTKLFASNYYADKASVYSTVDGTLISQVNTGAGPREIQLSNDETKMNVANASANTISVVNTASFQIVQTLTTGTLPRFIALSPDNSALVVSNYGSKNIQFFDATSGALTSTESTIGSANCHGVAFTPDGSSLWLALSSAGSLEHWVVTPALAAPHSTSPSPTPLAAPSQAAQPSLAETGLDAVPYLIAAFLSLGLGALALLASAFSFRKRNKTPL